MSVIPATSEPQVSAVERDGEHVLVTGSGELANAVILTLAKAGVTAADLPSIRPASRTPSSR